MIPEPAFSSNLLISAMNAEDLALLKPWLTRAPIQREQILCPANEVIKQVHFLEGGIASIVSLRPDSGRTEVGIFGREGMSGMTVAMELTAPPTKPSSR